MGRPRGGGSSYGLRRQSSGRRSSGHGVSLLLHSTGLELQMECVDDPLTPCQLEAIKKGKEEYRNALKKIEIAKADAAKAAEAMSLVPAQPSMGGSTSPDLMIVGESPPPPGAQVGQVASPPLATLPASLPGAPNVQSQGLVPTTAMMVGQGVVPQQVYRFVNFNQHGNNNNNNNVAAANSVQQNQWFLRPIMPVMPQQQAQRGPAPTSFFKTGTLPGPAGSPTIVSGTSGLGIKRPINMAADAQPSPVATKRPRGRPSADTDLGGGNWVPLDEYYYGKMEGDPTYSEEKSEFRFKCWMCTKMLYNNVKAMMHLQGHIDSEKQQNLDLSDLTQCKYCYKQFDTPFEMQTHIEKVHLNNVNVLMCRICEKDHESRHALTAHMRQNHCACEMPYACQLCNFRSSMYSDVVDHFKKKHDSSDNMLCLYCLRVFHIKFVSQGWGQTQTYYHHLLRHQSKTGNKKCTFCKLSFFNAQDLKNHRKTSHQPNQKGVIGVNAKYSTPDQVMIKVPETGIIAKKSGGPKSLNAPTVSKVMEHRGLRLPRATAVAYCFECKMLMNTSDHYKKYIQCSMCRFATSCSFAYATHMMGFHSGQVSSLSSSIPCERPMTAPLFCTCGFSSKLGNRIANHLVWCSKRTCYVNKPELPPSDKTGQDDQTDPRRKPDASILDALGLVKKQSVVNPTAEGEEESAIAGATSADIPDSKTEEALDKTDTAARDVPTIQDSIPGELSAEGFAASSNTDATGDQPSSADTSQAAPKSPTPVDEKTPAERTDISAGDGASAERPEPTDVGSTDGATEMAEPADHVSEERSSAGKAEPAEVGSGDAAAESSKEEEGGGDSEHWSADAVDQGESGRAETQLEGEDGGDRADLTLDKDSGHEETQNRTGVDPDTAEESRPESERATAGEARAEDNRDRDTVSFEESTATSNQTNTQAENDDTGEERDGETAGAGRPSLVSQDYGSEDEEEDTATPAEEKGIAGSAEEAMQEDEQELDSEREENISMNEQEEDEKVEHGAQREENISMQGEEGSVHSTEDRPQKEKHQQGSTADKDESGTGSEEKEELATAADDKERAAEAEEEVAPAENQGNSAAKMAEPPSEETEQSREAPKGDSHSSEQPAIQDKDGGEETTQSRERSQDDAAKTSSQEQTPSEKLSRWDRDQSSGYADSSEPRSQTAPEDSEKRSRWESGEGSPSSGYGDSSHPRSQTAPEDSNPVPGGAGGDGASGMVESGGGGSRDPSLRLSQSQPEDWESGRSGGRIREGSAESSKEMDRNSTSSGHSQSQSYSSRDRHQSVESDSRDRLYDRHRDHSSSHSDYRDRNRDRDYRRDRDRYDRDRDYYDGHRHHDKYRDQRYDSHHGRCQQGGHGARDRDRYYDQNRHGNRGGQNRHDYQDRSYHRGYY